MKVRNTLSHWTTLKSFDGDSISLPPGVDTNVPDKFHSDDMPYGVINLDAKVVVPVPVVEKATEEKVTEIEKATPLVVDVVKERKADTTEMVVDRKPERKDRNSTGS